MKPFTKSWYIEQAEENRMYPERARGQNFLIHTDVVEKMVENLAPTADDTIIEIGPGFGVLTAALAQTDATIQTFDIEEKFQHTPAISKLIEDKKIAWHTQDILKTDETQFPKDYIIAANLPYNITSDVIIKFLTSHNPPKTIMLMLQNEVVDRLIAQPPYMTQIAVTTQLLSEPKKLFKVTREAFWPIPQVDSAVVRLDRREVGEHTQTALKLARTGFSFKRKKLANNLAALVDDPKTLLEKSNINPNVRAQELSMDEWLRLATAFDSM